MILANVYEVRRRTKTQISEYAEYVRHQFNIRDRYVDIVKVVEVLFPSFVPNYSLRIVNGDDTDIDMEHVAAYTELLDGEKITMYVREDIYDKALIDIGYARFTLAHECGHVLMHYQDNIPFQRIRKAHLLRTDIEPEKDPEWQANQFAAEFLAPKKLTRKMPIRDIMGEFKVSYECATNCKR